MVKAITKFICQQCGYESVGFLGRCPNCGNWGSLVETLVAKESGRIGKEEKERARPISLGDIKSARTQRFSTKISEFDRVLGGGIVSSSVNLLAGEPGVGKSTLLLQTAANVFSGGEGKVFYVSGEESFGQVKMRAERLGIEKKEIFFLSETNVEAIIKEIKSLREENIRGENVLKKFDFLVIIDSIQTLYASYLTGTPGSVGQVRECTFRLLDFAKKEGVSFFLIGHVTKEGSIAGPMVLAHLVDTVLFFEGERFQSLRLLRGVKNRFGPTDEVGVFEMTEKGLLAVENPSRLFLGELREVPGSVVFCAMEGERPILVEIQSLVTKSFLAVPRRVVNGFDYNRLLMLTAVLQKSLNLPLWDQDIYLNIAGGFKINEPAADLAVCLAIISSFQNKPIMAKTCALGEVGLLGEIREIGNLEKRIKEAKRLGFTRILTSKEVRNLSSVFKLFKSSQI